MRTSKNEVSCDNFVFLKVQKQSLIDILKYFLNVKFPDNIIPHEAQIYLDTLKQPSIDKMQITTISENADSLLSLPDILAPIASTFRFDINLLRKYANSERKCFPHVTFAFILSWFCIRDLNPFTSDLHYLLDIINELPELVSQNIKRFCLKETFSHYIQSTNQAVELELFRKVLDDCDAYFFDLAVAEFWASNDSCTQLYIMELISISIEKNHDTFFESNFSPLISTLSPFLEILDANALKLLTRLSYVKEDSSLISAICGLPKIIENNIKNQIVFPLPQKELFPINSFSDFIYNFDSQDTLPDGLKPLSINLFDEGQNIELLIPENFIQISVTLSNFVGDLTQQWTNLFFESFAKYILDLHSNEMYLIFVLLITKIEHGNMTDIIIQALLHPVIFCPGITLFNSSNLTDYSLVFSIRKTVLDLFLTKQQKSMANVLKMLRKYSILFAEIIGRIHSKLSYFNLDYITGEETLSPIIHTLSQQWVLLKNYQNDEKVEIIRSARSTIFIFLFTILNIKKVCIRCFSSATFVCGFLPRALEPSLQGSVLSSLSKFFMFYDKSLNSTIDITTTKQVLCGIFDVCQSGNTKLALDLLNVINEAAAIYQLPEFFEPLTPSITSFLSKYPSKSFLTQTFQLFSQLSLTSASFELNHSQIQQISSAVRIVEGNDPSNDTISALLGLIGLSRNVNSNAMFLIRKPSIITLLFSIIRSRSKLEDLLNFFNKLCKYSIFNVCQCHRGEFDFLLLEMMNNISKPFTFRGCSFDALVDIDLMKRVALPLLINIASIISSNAVATKLMRFISLRQELSVTILNNLNAKLSSLVKMSLHIIPVDFTGEPLFVIKGINSSSINQCYSMQMSLLVDKPLTVANNQKHIIFELDDPDDELKISYLVSGDSIILQVSTDSNFSSCVLCQNFPNCTWMKISLIFCRIDNDTGNFIFIMNDYVPNHFTVNCPNMKSSNITASIGYTQLSLKSTCSNFGNYTSNAYERFEDKNGFPCFIGRFCFYPIIISNELCQGSANIRSHRYSEVNAYPLFSYPEEEYSNSYRLNNGREKTVNQMKSILEVFGDSQILDYLPLFPPLDSMPEMFPQLLLSLISTIISYSSKQQENIGVFPVIAQLLMESNPKRLTYSLYQRLFAFIDCCTNESLTQELISHILLNFELWIKAEPAHLNRIAAHWGSSLYAACGRLLDEAMSFSSLIALIRMYFWFCPIEADIICGKNRSSDFDIDLIRQHIDRLLTSIIKANGFKPKYVSAILSHCASCQDTKQVIHFLALFRNNCMKLNQSVIKQLFFFFKPKKEAIFIETLKAIYTIASKDTISSIIYEIISILNNLFCTEFLLNNLLDILHEFPLTYPIAIYISFSLGITAMEATSKRLKEIESTAYPLIIRDDLWMIYPLLLAVNMPSPVNLNAIFFICSVINENFNVDILIKVLTALDFFSAVTKLPFGELEEKIIKIIIDLNLTNTNIIRKELFEIGAKIILLHSSPNSSSLSQAYKVSPFYSKDDDLTNNNNTDNDLSIILQSHQNQSPFLSSTGMPQTRFSPNTIKQISATLDQPSKQDSQNNFDLMRSDSNYMIFDLPEAKTRKMRRSKTLSLTFDSWNFMSCPNSDEPYIVSSINDLISIFSIDQSKIKEFRFGIHLSNIQQNNNLNNLTTNQNNNQITNFNNNGISFYHNELFENVCNLASSFDKPQQNVFNTTLYHVSQYLNDVLNRRKIESVYTDSLLHFFHEESTIWTARIKNFIVKSKKYFMSSHANALTNLSFFGKAEVGIAFEDIEENKLFQRDTLLYSGRMRSLLERRFGDILNADNKLYRHSFRFCANFSQPKLCQYPQHETFYINEATISPEISSSIVFNYPCKIVKIIDSILTNFILTKESIILEGHKIIPLSELKMILVRRFMQRKTGIELFTDSGRDILIDFSPISSKVIIKGFRSVKLPDGCLLQRFSVFKNFCKNANNATESWISRKMTNFEYLMQINIFSGRSFRDASNYPILPWVITDYTTSAFSLNDIGMFRDLSYPIAAQTPSSRSILHSKFDENMPACDENAMFMNAPSNPTIVAHWLIRMEPFTALHIDSENGRFGFSSRLFKSLEQAIEQMQINTSCWELTPEFFSQPEVFLNLNQINGIGSDDVKMPKWCKDAFELVYILRKALESEIVSEKLNKWIDLMFGISSSGEEAIERCNVFLPMLLTNVWKNENENEDDRKLLIESTLQKSGQMPATLFKMAHPTRSPEKIIDPIVDRTTEVLITNNDVRIEDASVFIDTKFSEKNKCELYLLLIFTDGFVGTYKLIFDITNTNSSNRKSSFNSTNSDSIDLHSTIIFNINNLNNTNNHNNGTNENIDTNENSDANENSGNSIFNNKNGIIVKEVIKMNKKMSLPKKVNFTNFEQGIIVCSTNNQVSIVSPTANIIDVDINTCPNNDCFESSNIFVTSGDQNSFVLVNNDGTVYYSPDPPHVQSTISLAAFKDVEEHRQAFEIGRVHCEKPLSAAISENFRSIAIASIEGGVTIYSLPDALYFCKCDTDHEIVENMIFTQGWGFIATITSKSMFLFNINGFCIRKIPRIQPNIVLWCTWKSDKGFDYIGAILEDGGVIVCEAFYLNFGNPIAYLRGAPVMIQYINEIRSFIVITKNRSAVVIPYNYTELLFFFILFFYV
ncbi:hypothetical protein TRFO_37367 [Tritrichomonas foetus]|uniref:BEACH domain-containing protein n=1 Tax=Tritrichomonas foetus TaxID=1144522 RepID=A0A1J4JFN4_9EUKA|nr:hypothetical protein TRFO_37367 [Tritrichomonas foetus]|eukprot:OHS96451.1 hypothetical protein TRFO_37367 [Tritrichomonas foetus]